MFQFPIFIPVVTERPIPGVSLQARPTTLSSVALNSPSMRRLKHTELYNILGIHTDATDEDIKRAFRRLALQYHPDKVPGQEEHFQRINYAYNKLSLPTTRRLYDRYGDIGLALYGTIKSEALVEVLLNTRRLRWLVIALIKVLLLVSLFPSLVALKVAGVLSNWPWALLSLPLWLLDAYVAILGVALFRLVWSTVCESSDSGTSSPFFENSPGHGDNVSSENCDEETGYMGGDGDNANLDKIAFLIITIILSTVFFLLIFQQLLLILRLDHVGWIGRRSWWLILAPILAYFSLRLIYHGVSTIYAVRKWEQVGPQLVGSVESRLPSAAAYYAFTRLRWPIMQWSCLFLLLLRIGSGWKECISWTIVTAPFYLISVTSFILDYRFALERERILLAGTFRAPSASSSASNEGDPATPIRVSHSYYAVYGLGLIYVLLMTFLINARLAGWITSWTIALLPIYLASIGLGLVVMVGGILVYSLIGTAFLELSGTNSTRNSPEWMRGFGYALSSPLQRLIRNGN